MRVKSMKMAGAESFEHVQKPATAIRFRPVSDKLIKQYQKYAHNTSTVPISSKMSDIYFIVDNGAVIKYQKFMCLVVRSLGHVV